MSELEGRQRVVTDVWDWELRVLHWLNALLIISLALIMIGKEVLGDLGVPKEVRSPLNAVHAYVGYFFVLVLILRVIWGFAGSRYSRWSDIIPSDAGRWRDIGTNVRWVLRGFSGRPAKAVGHDPLASLLYMALFAVLASQAVTGLLLAGIELDMFPGSVFVVALGEGAREGLEEALEEVHEFGLFFIIFFLFFHIAGLVAHELREKTGLFSSMIHGKKYLRKDE